jgi:hypothetical protein
VSESRSATLLGGVGEDRLHVQVYNPATRDTDGSARLDASFTLDGGSDNDALVVEGYTYTYYGQAFVEMDGGTGDDLLTATAYNAGDTGNNGQIYGISKAVLDGGEGNDVLTAGGILQLSLTGGSGVDSFVLTAQQYRTLQEGTRSFHQEDGSYIAVDALATVITDFTTGIGGDVLDYSDLLQNGTLTYDGSNPFNTGFLTLVQDGADTLINFDADGSAGTVEAAVTIARLQNVTATELIESNFNPNYPTDGAEAVGFIGIQNLPADMNVL